MRRAAVRGSGQRAAALPLRLVRDSWAILGFIVLWEIWVRVGGISIIVMPSPSAVLAEIVTHFSDFAASAALTLALSVTGLILGMMLGTTLAVLSWLSPVLAGLLTPLGLVFASVPVVALIPILARVFGYDTRTVLAIVTIITFLPAFVFTNSGLRALPPGADDLFRVLGAGRWRRLRDLAGPAALLDWSIALRLAAANSVLAAMVAEFLMGTGGLGHMFDAARSELDMPRALGASAIAALLSMTAFLLASTFERRLRRMRA